MDDHNSTFSNAALMIALRQDIFISNSTQRPIEHLHLWPHIDKSFEPSSDAMWAFRIITFAAELCNFAYGFDRSTMRWEEHWRYLQDWHRLKPDAFKPVFRHHPENAAFPQVYFVGHLQLAAFQYQILCNLILLAFDPHIPAMGIHRGNMLARKEMEMRNAVRETCGAALSDHEWFPAKLNASLAVAMCGELFEDHDERRQLVGMLDCGEIHLGWQCLKVGSKFRELWHVSLTP